MWSSKVKHDVHFVHAYVVLFLSVLKKTGKFSPQGLINQNTIIFFTNKNAEHTTVTKTRLLSPTRNSFINSPPIKMQKLLRNPGNGPNKQNGQMWDRDMHTH